MTLALDRGIQILAELGNAQGLTLSEIARRTGIPKTTAHRLLKLLCEKRLVRQNLLDQRYRSNVLLPQQAEIHIPPADQPLIETICHYAEALTAKVMWPTDIFIPIEKDIVLVESTRTLTRVYVPDCRIQVKVSTLDSAAGRVFLAFSDPDSIEGYLQNTWQKQSSTEQERQHFYDTWPAIRDRIRKQGYAFRAPSYFGGREISDGYRAIAAPIFVDGTIRACINLIWSKNFASEETFADTFAQQLLNSADEISKQLTNK